MKRTTIKVALAFLLTACSLNIHAIDGNFKEVPAPKAQIVKSGDDVVVSSAIDLSGLKLGSSRSMIYYPVLTDGTNKKALPEVIVNGSRKHILYTRRPSKTAYTEVKRKNGTEQVVKYNAGVPYESWMENATLNMYVDLCGCGGKPQENMAYENLTTLNNEIGMPELSYVCPMAEVEKRRSDSGKAFLDFPVNSTIIKSDYHTNRNELAKIQSTIDKVKQDKNLTITGIEIHGYASPEGSYTNNTRLAEGRAQALKQYVSKLYNFEDNVISAKSTPEDIEGLKRYLEEANLEGAKDALKIIAETADADAMESKLKTLDNGKLFSSLLEDCMPTLRHSDYTVFYTARNYTVEEAKEIMKTNPKQLSLNEFYMVANTYKPGSDEYNETFETAVRMFPTDATANLNASSVALAKKDLSKAEKYLSKTDKNNPMALNNMASLELLKGNMEAAKDLYRQAADNGCAEAKVNYNKNFNE